MSDAVTSTKSTTIKDILKRKDFWAFLVLFTAYVFITFILFHRQACEYDGRYPSDMPEYLGVLKGENQGLRMPYPLMFWLARLFSLVVNEQWGLTCSVTVLNGLSAIALYWCFLNTELKDDKKRGVLYVILLFALLFVSMIYPFSYTLKMFGVDATFEPRYLGIYSPNPFHNATYLVARPFAILTFLLYVKLIDTYELQDRWFCKEYLLFSVTLFTATLAKPSFTLVFVANAGLVMLWHLIVSKFKNWKAFFQFGIYFIPTFALLLYQYSDVFYSETENASKGMVFAPFAVWKYYSNNIPVSILLAIAFPLIVAVFQYKKLIKKSTLQKAWLLYLIASLTFMLFSEKGYRLKHANFAWGYMYGLFFLHAVSLLELVRATRNSESKRGTLAIQWAFWVLHLIYGIDYFRVLMSGDIWA